MFTNEFSKLITSYEENASLEPQILELLKIAIFLAMDKPDEATVMMLEYKNNGGGQNNIDAILALIAAAKLSYLQDTSTIPKVIKDSSCCL